jgi:hypothetical protein
MKRIAFAILAVLLPVPAFAAIDPALAEHLAARLSGADEAFQKACSEQGATAGGYEFTHFFLNLTPTAQFGIGKVLSVEVAPEITFIWEKVELQ